MIALCQQRYLLYMTRRKRFLNFYLSGLLRFLATLVNVMCLLLVFDATIGIASARLQVVIRSSALYKYIRTTGRLAEVVAHEVVASNRVCDAPLSDFMPSMLSAACKRAIWGGHAVAQGVQGINSQP